MNLSEIIPQLKANDPGLTCIDLGGNQIGDAGAQALAGALKVNCTVASIDLVSNGIGDAGAQALAGALKVNRTVMGIYLRFNEIGEAGALPCKLDEALTETLLGHTNA